MTKEAITEILDCSSKEAVDIMSIYRICSTSITTSNSVENGNRFNFSKFISCFDEHGKYEYIFLQFLCRKNVIVLSEMV